MKILAKWLTMTLVTMSLPYFLEGIQVNSWTAAFVFGAVCGLLNTFLRPVLLFLTLPLNILTLGLFTWVVNALLFSFAGYLVRGIEIESFGWALLGSLVVSFVNWLILGGRSRVSFRTINVRRPDMRVRRSKEFIDLTESSSGKWS